MSSCRRSFSFRSLESLAGSVSLQNGLRVSLIHRAYLLIPTNPLLPSRATESPQARRDSLSGLSSPAQSPISLQRETARASHASFHHSLQASHLARLLSSQRLLAKLRLPHLYLSRFFDAAQLPEPQRTAALKAEVEQIRQTMRLVDKAVVAVEEKRSVLEKLVEKLEEQRASTTPRITSSCTRDPSDDDTTPGASEDDHEGISDDETPSETIAEVASASKFRLQLSALHLQISTLSKHASRLWYRRACLQTYWARVDAVSARDEGAVRWLAEKLSTSTTDVGSAEANLEDSILILVVLRGQREL